MDLRGGESSWIVPRKRVESVTMESCAATAAARGGMGCAMAFRLENGTRDAEERSNDAFVAVLGDSVVVVEAGNDSSDDNSSLEEKGGA